MSRHLLALSLAAVLAWCPAAGADDKDPSKSNLPLRLKLVAKKDTYKLDADSKELKKTLEAAKESGNYPAPPAVELMLEVTNTSDKAVRFWASGDPVQVGIELKGPGAVTVKPRRAFTLELRLPKPMKLAPGKSHTIPVNKLAFGFRNASEQAYWTEPGEYTIVVTLKTGISPAPKGTKADRNGFAPVTLKSDPVKVQVKEK